ncbi:hypothetical protein Riv7116_1784 [Rivularia sp. PCC 7116]|uniref:hypothetical protein n=1 Tax=Rivularia sp. PCC 7116 TaxID=373994 RepID=UPI00029F2D4E|nr:hypothetical protein [Rivularia sp. PCC 7116]AFY54328.1 hypothetical protein Riv7116_1784 [Rivularia sp. PCC 7116]MDY6900153.1 hypothetical protein [Cyanobacteriota bacterium]
MKSLKLGAIVLGSIGLIFVGACSNQTANSEDSAASKTETVAQKGHSENDGHDHSEDEKEGEHSHGGQVIESGQYHLELVAEPSDDGTHMDFYLEKGEKHEKVSNAQVTAQVQLPNGEQKSIPLEYEADEKHYHAILPEKTAGEYKVAILSEVDGEKVNGRFSFKR